VAPKKFALGSRAAIVVYAMAVLILVGYLLVTVLSPRYNVIYFFSELEPIAEVELTTNGVNKGTVELPYNVADLQPDDVVSVQMTLEGKRLNNLLVKGQGVQIQLYIDGELHYTRGEPDTYPSFQREPPDSLDSVSLPSSTKNLDITVEYTISSISDALYIPVYYQGDPNLITNHVLMESYVPFIMSVLMLIMGIILSIVGLLFYSRAELAISLFWLGLSALACSCWTLFSNDLMLLFFNQPLAFYTISKIGLFVLPIPLIRFIVAFLQPRHSRFATGFSIVMMVVFLALLVCHVGGILSFGQVEPVFRVIASLIIAIILSDMCIARFYQGVEVPPLLILATALLLVLAVVDVTPYYLHITNVKGTLFMIGIFFYALVVSLLVLDYLAGVLDAAEKNMRLEADLSAMARSLDLQRRHFEEFTASAARIREARHDMRHQLLALQGFINENKGSEALEYIDDLLEQVPTLADRVICDNIAVNSLAVYYLAKAHSEQIQCDVKLDVPYVLGRVSDGDLSIIFGNLFENAVEACLHVDADKRFIRIRGNTRASRFTLIIDNSYDGFIKVRGTDFYSRKRNGFGIGIASVKAVVTKYDGSMKYEAESGIFKTSLYIKS
jgi:signal transduction histidine kinase